MNVAVATVHLIGEGSLFMYVLVYYYANILYIYTHSKNIIYITHHRLAECPQGFLVVEIKTRPKGLLDPKVIVD